MNELKRIMVTGGAGFIGSNYVHYSLINHPERDLVVFDKLTYAGNLDNLADVMDKITFIKGDIAESEQVREAISGVDAVVNFAAESHVDRAPENQVTFALTNSIGPVVLVMEALKSGVSRVLQVSTDEVYGDVSGTNRKSLETDPMRPHNIYSASKHMAETTLRALPCPNLEVVFTRGSNTYGPCQYPEKIIPLFIMKLLQDQPVPVYGDGSAVRDYMHVEDHVSGIDLVLEKGITGEVYNLGADLQISGKEVAQRLVELTGRSEDLISYVADRPGHDYRYSVDSSKAQALGWERKWNFEDGLAQTVEWYDKNRDWWRKILEKTEAES